ncbi:MAG: polymerase [Treponema sp.]|jgi:hypothetical protein|nr:polymerase [Treponema sp.]
MNLKRGRTSRGGFTNALTRTCFFALQILALALPASAQTWTRISAGIDWDRMELNALVTLDLEGAGIRLPAGRARAEALLEEDGPELALPFIMDLQADSSATLRVLVDRGELSLHDAASLAREAAESVPPVISADLSSMSVRYTYSLAAISGRLMRHTRPRDIQAPLIPSPADNYTGVIVIADETLPVHGKQTGALVRPCLFPKIWDSAMNLIYERNMIDPGYAGMVRYAVRDAVTAPSPSGLDEALVSLVGTNPLRIMARSVFGAVPTDPVIDREDALLILSTENNRRLLREGRVALILNRETLQAAIGK